MNSLSAFVRFVVVSCALIWAQTTRPPAPLSKFPFPTSGLELQQPTHPGAFFDVVGLKLLRVEPDAGALHLVVEGLGGRTYSARIRSPHRVSEADGVTVLPADGRDQRIEIRFEGRPDEFVRRQITLPLR